MRKLVFFLPLSGCLHRCVYCDQHSISGIKTTIPPDEVRKRIAQESHPVEICFFGGSFTCLPRKEMIRYLDASLAAPLGSRIRLSTHPLGIDLEVISILKRYPVSCVELGLSSLDDQVLSTCKRGYTRKEAMNALALLKDSGVGIAVQMMIGLPGQTQASSFCDLEALYEVKGPQGWEMRLYPCLVLSGTPLEILYKEKKYVPLSLEEAIHWGASFSFRARKLGFTLLRIGLQDSPSLKQSVVAGPYHPALGELIRAEELASLMLENRMQGPWFVEKRHRSWLLGHGKQGLLILSKGSGLDLNEVLQRIRWY